MIDRSCLIRRLFAAALLLPAAGCSHRQSGAVTAAAPKPVAPAMLAVVVPAPPAPTAAPAPPKTFNGSGFQFDYPSDWQSTKGKTAVFAITAAVNPPNATTKPSLNLDIPKLPWHLPGMITPGMVSSGYVSDLKKNQIPDAAVKEEVAITVAGETGKRVTCSGHIAGQTSTDVAVILVHQDRVYILSADSDDAGCDCARKTIDQAVATWKWTK
jgi:hypothetical protein